MEHTSRGARLGGGTYPEDQGGLHSRAILLPHCLYPADLVPLVVGGIILRVQ